MAWPAIKDLGSLDAATRGFLQALLHVPGPCLFALRLLDEARQDPQLPPFRGAPPPSFL